MEIKWLPEAISDLKEIYEYISLDSKTYAKNQILKIKEKIEILKQYPDIGKLVEEINKPEIKEIVVGNYRIIYRRINKNRIDILMIHHGARDMYRRIQE